MKNSRSGWLRRTSGSSERMGKSGSFGSLFSIRSSWKRFGVSCRVSLRPEWTVQRDRYVSAIREDGKDRTAEENAPDAK